MMAMCEKPILFSTEMVKAILEGIKTQTRRQIKNQPTGDHAIDLKQVYRYAPEYFYEVSPYGKPGDLLYVKETFQHTKILNINPEDENYGFVYRADGQPWHEYEGWKWKPSLFMPKIAARIWLMIEDISVERLKDISKEDAILEGIIKVKTSFSESGAWANYNLKDDDLPYYFNSVHSFESLWKSINGLESWDQNPYVWVIKFRVLSKIGRP